MERADIIGFILSALPGLAALLAVILSNRKIRAEAHKIQDESDKVEAEKRLVENKAAAIIQNAAFDLNKQYKQRMEELEQDFNRRMRPLEKSNNQLKGHVIKLEGQLRDVLNCLVDTVEGANKLFNQVKKQNVEPEYTPPSMELIKGRRESILKHIDPLEPV